MIRIKTNKTTRAGKFRAWALLLVLFCAYCFLAAQPDLRFAVIQWVMVSGFILVLLVLFLFLDTSKSALESPGFILLVAVLLRLLFVVRPAEFSDDIFRYVFDGLQSLSGHNPYAMSPQIAGPLVPHLADLLGHVNHPDLVTIYPPGAQVLFLLGASVSKSVWGIKSVLMILDIGTCGMLLYLLSVLNKPLKNCILYAWHPLAVMETAGSGHVDAAMISFFYLSVLFLTRGPHSTRSRQDIFRSLASGLFYMVSIWIKLLPLVYLPFYLKSIRPGYRFPFMAAVFLGSMALCLPFLPDLAHAADTLWVYARHWEFSGLLYRGLVFLGLTGPESRMVLATGFSVTLGILYYRSRKSNAVAPDTLLNFLSATYGVTLAFLLFTPTLHPWYALYLVVLLPFFPNVFGIVLSWSVLLSYRVLILYFHAGQWLESDLIPVLIWAGPTAGFFVNRYWQSRSTSKTGSIPLRPHQGIR